MTSEDENLGSLQDMSEAIQRIGTEFDADIIVYSGNMFPPADMEFVSLLRKRKLKRKNVLLVLSTPGGSADVAYRIGRVLQLAYVWDEGDKVQRGDLIIYVPTFCKSAGTVLALGANKLIMSQTAELGPIDVQLRKDDEVGDWTSGLTAVEALNTLQQKAISLFVRHFRQLRFGRESSFSTKMAADVAARLTVGLLDPIYAQVDPMRLGEIERFVRISVEYGDRLATNNVRDRTVERLVVGYPSHGFIIDRKEARTLFNDVAKPSDDLEMLGESAWNEALNAGVLESERVQPIIRFMNDERPNEDQRVTTKHPTARINSRTGRGGKAKAVRKSSAANRSTSNSPSGRNGASYKR